MRLLENNPLTLDGSSIYQWRSTSSTGNITDNEQNARRISDRIAATISGWALSEVRTFNRKREHEYWFLWNGNAVILNYANDSWYYYTNMPFQQMVDVEDDTYGITEDGKIKL